MADARRAAGAGLAKVASPITAGDLVRAARLPFCTASALPYAAGYALAEGRISWGLFLAGLLAVTCTHLAANLLNDVADSRSGNDWKDAAYFGLFGGSKLIQQGRLSEGFYLRYAMVMAALAAAGASAVAWLHADVWPLPAYAGVLAWGAAYSLPPLKLSYRYGGEATVLALFGGMTVFGGAYCRSGGLPTATTWAAAASMGLATVGVLWAGEIADHRQDADTGKRNLAALMGPRRGWLGYAALLLAASAIPVALVLGGEADTWLLAALTAWVPAGRATIRLKRSWDDRPALVPAARQAIFAQTLLAGAWLLGGLAG